MKIILLIIVIVLLFVNINLAQHNKILYSSVIYAEQTLGMCLPK